jgi:mannose-6-phosphate isomerase-like protein (cupin superfamily)
VLTIIDLNAEMEKLRMLRGRTPETPEADREGSFVRLAPYRDSAINAAKFSGEGPWERHSNGDEIVQVVDGTVTFHIMTDDGPQSHALKAGMVVIVPQGAWHRFESPDGVSLMTTTPQPTQHLTFAVDDPRGLESR